LIAIAAFIGAVGLSTVPSQPEAAVVIARVTGGAWGDAPPCLATDICLDGIYVARMKRLRHLAGAGVPKRFEASMWLHVRPRRNPWDLALLLQRKASGEWFVVSKSSATEPCFDAAVIRKLGLVTTPHAERANGKICFPS